MTTRAIPLLTVSGTDAATATLTDWLIRSLTPTVLDAAGMVDAADDLCALAPVTSRRLARPRRLRSHERHLRQIIASIEDLLRQPAAAGAARCDDLSVRPIPDEILDVAAHLGGTIADLGIPAAALANRVLHLGAVVVESGRGATAAEHLHAQITESYRSLLTYLWNADSISRSI